MTPSTTVNFTNGSYAYTASSSNATYSAPPGGFRVSGGPANASVPFALLTFAIEFSESGLPMGTRWYAVILGGRSAPSTTENLSVNETNGTYAYTFAVADRSYAAPGGVVQVAGEAVSVSVIFARLTYPITFAETGLPRFTPWWLNASGTSPGLTTSGSITFEEPNGTYYYNASRPDRTYTTPSGSFTVSGSALTVPVAYGRVTFPVVFTESGLPSGRPWSVTLDGVLRTGTGNLEFASVWNGSHAFSVGAVSGYRSDPGNGSLVVQGALAAKAISFTANAVTFLGLPVVEGASLLGGLAAALVVVGVVFALRTRARRRRGGLGPTGPRAGPARPPGPGRTVRPGGPSPARPPRKAPPAPPAT
ncbi:MAG TPA: hypothetical protein VGS23_00565 [Thermoplasmata archaeon]|nr:hypothetical protein [Thermoplasmata archaeon]